MEFKFILFVIILLFIGANILCSCCRYPIFDYITGQSNIKEGISNNDDVGSPSSLEAVKRANKDIAEIMSKNQPVPPILNPPNEGFIDMGGIPNVFETGLNVIGVQQQSREGFIDMGGIPNVFETGLNVITGPASRDEKITVSNSSKEGMSTMGSNVNEVQNGDIAGMWVNKANMYASDFGYNVINNAGSSYSADKPLKNGELVIFAKNKFKPECCPSPYSSSTGCVCMTPEQINYLNTRGGNRTTESGI